MVVEGWTITFQRGAVAREARQARGDGEAAQQPPALDHRGDDHGPLRALAFVINRQSRFYTVRLPPEENADALARAYGHWGSCAEDLHTTVAQLEERGIRDRNL